MVYTHILSMNLLQKFVFLLLIFLVFIPCMNAQENWKTFKPNRELFSLNVPGEMKYGEKNLLTDVGNLKVITYLYQAGSEEKNYLYLINYVDYPEGTFHSDSSEIIQDFFDITIEQNIKDLGGELVYSSEFFHQNYPGRIYRVSYNKNKAVLKSHIYLVHDRFYSLQVFTLSEKSLNPDMDRFLNSFKLDMK